MTPSIPRYFCKVLNEISFSLLLSICLFLFFAPGVYAVDIDQRESEITYKKLELFANILSILQENYVEEIETDQVIEGAINGMLLSLDPHSSFLSPENFEELQNETQGSFTGIGIELTVKDSKLTVISPIEDTPAHKAGIQVNDIIVKIGDRWTKDMSPLESIKQLRGPKGSAVTISIQRNNEEKLLEYTLIRDLIPVNSVRAFMLERGIVYSRITNFQGNTTEDYIAAIERLQKQQQIAAIILDLRNNPGGLLNQAVSVSDLFLDSGIIVYTKGRTEDQNMVFKAKKTTTKYTATPLMILVNEGTASASEIVAGAIQDRNRGLILGSRTFGKGSIQTVVPLQDGAGLRITTARYFTPSGKSIQARGIIPDIEIPQVSYSQKESASQQTFPREQDLAHHIENGTKLTVEKPAIENDEIAEKVKKDHQLQTALNIIKGVTLMLQ